jgi:hypothetical protein
MSEASQAGAGKSTELTELAFLGSASHKIRLVTVADLLDVLRSIERSSQRSNSIAGSVPAPALPSAATILLESREAFYSGDFADALMLATKLMDSNLRLDRRTIEDLRTKLSDLTDLAPNFFDEMQISQFGNLVVRYLASIPEPCKSIGEIRRRAEERLQGPWPSSDDDECEESITEWLGIEGLDSASAMGARTIERFVQTAVTNGSQQPADLDLDDRRKYTPKEIRMKLDCSDTTVRNHARSAGLPTRRSRGDWYSCSEFLQLCRYIAVSGTSDSALRTKAMHILESESEPESFQKAES